MGGFGWIFGVGRGWVLDGFSVGRDYRFVGGFYCCLLIMGIIYLTSQKLFLWKLSSIREDECWTLASGSYRTSASGLNDKSAWRISVYSGNKPISLRNREGFFDQPKTLFE